RRPSGARRTRRGTVGSRPPARRRRSRAKCPPRSTKAALASPATSLGLLRARVPAVLAGGACNSLRRACKPLERRRRGPVSRAAVPCLTGGQGQREADVEVRLLGPLDVLVDGRSVQLGGAKQRALLAILTIHANEVLPAERLVDELWPSHAPES